MMEKTKIFIGTSGWTYPHWKGTFYPDEIPKSRWFSYYSEKFNTVEVNATFYRSFKESTYQKWFDQSPDDFQYVLKAPKWITHRKYLKNCEADIASFLQQTSSLKNKLGLILLQLSPSTPYNPDLLDKALRMFEKPERVAVEFRHERWLTEEVRGLLMELHTVFCNADSPKFHLMDWLTSETAYFRMHGRRSWYNANCLDEDLQALADRIITAAQGVKTVNIFFNNDAQAFAPKNALTLSNIFRDRAL